MYSLSRFMSITGRGRLESWDFGRKNILPVWPEFAGQQFYSGNNFFTHLHPSSHALEIPLEGDLRIEHGDRITTVKPGTFYLLPAGEPNTLRPGAGGSCWKLSIGLCGRLVVPLLAELGFSGDGNLFSVGDIDTVIGIFGELFPLIRRKQPEDAPELAALAVRLLVELRTQQPGAGDRVTREAAGWMRKHLADAVSLPELAEQLHMTEFQLIRHFRRTAGTTPMARLAELRMRHAAELLDSAPELSGDELARRCGYGSFRCFSRAFRRHFGVPPREFTGQEKARRLPEPPFRAFRTEGGGGDGAIRLEFRPGSRSAELIPADAPAGGAPLSAALPGRLAAPFLAALGFPADMRRTILLLRPDRFQAQLEELPGPRRAASAPELAARAVRLMMELRDPYAPPPPPPIADAVRIFEFNLGCPITLETVAAELRLPKAELIRLFRRTLGTTPKAFLAELRMNKAEALLAGSARPAGEIARECGYSTERSFAFAFRRKHGVSPREFRRNGSSF